MNTVTYNYSIYTFTGGAHGSAYITLYTFDKNGKRLSPEDTLPERYLEKVSKVSLEKAIQEKIERNNFNISSQDFKVKYPEDYKWLQDGTKPVRENYKNVWFEKNKDGQDDLVIYFDDYQLWSHAEGGGFTISINRGS